MRDTEALTAIVLLNWNGKDDTLATLASLAAVENVRRHLILVDNGSTDGSVAAVEEAYPDVEIIQTGENLGFAGGNIVGMRRALENPEIGFLLLLNTDVEVDPGFLRPLIDACADPEVGAAGSKIFYFDPRDVLWAAGGRLRVRETVTVERGKGRADGPEFQTPCDVSYLTTCCILMPRDAIERVGLLDPAYFINVEDADWCRRATDAGFRLRYVPSSILYHKVAASTQGSYTPFKTFHSGRSNALWVRRHGGTIGMIRFLLANTVALPVAFIRELFHNNTRAVIQKARGIVDGLTAPFPPPPAS